MVGKCLVVLDDVWTNHGIGVDELLKDLLSMSCEGSKILMTMRSTEDIPPMTDRRYIIYQLQGLPEADCWSIIKNIAFGHGGFYGIPGEPVWVKQIFSLSLLRVLTLCHPEIKELPQSICNLKNLRYLDLSYTAIETFPSSFSQLYNLQTLRLKGCKLKELPKDMRKMIGLEYFIFSEARLTQMPREVSRCIKLKGLSVFVVGTGKGYGIEELKDLNLLGGKLIIENLGSVTDATQANLMGKEKIMHLQLHWDLQRCDDDPSRTAKDTEVMNGLRPHKDLKKLKISRFVGSGFPTWLMSPSIHLPNLVTIQLYDCHNCEHLPALGRLRSLKYLRMERMRAITQIGDEFHQSNEEPSFPFLVELYLCSFINLEEWLEDQRSSAASFSCLEMLEISDCSKLSTTPTIFPSLKRLDFAIKLVDDPNLKSLPLKLLRGANNVLQTLVVSDCNEFVGFLPDNGEEQQHYQPDEPSNNYLSKIEILSCPSLTVLPADFRRLNSLTYLAIKDCGSLKSLPDGIQYLPALQTLIIGGFSDDLDSFPFPEATGSDAERYFVSLRELTICGWPTLKDVLLDQLQHLTSLHRLNIKDFPGLLSLPEWFGELSSLRILDIENCRKLEYLPSEEEMLRLTSLQILNIRYSPLLLERCCFPNEEWHKIAHLKQVSRSSPSLLDHINREADMNEELEARRRSGIFSDLNKEASPN
ncbi:hypothetical protein MKW92_003485 [Papaver armeniacum]|nr:hypothetical protein MKW92_003485 [Papaver armeniacum]